MIIVATVGATTAACGSSKKKRRVATGTTTSSTTSSTTESPSTTVDPSTSSTTAAPAVPPPVFNWQACGDGFQCTPTHPPLDYDHPDGPTVHVALTRLPASGGPSKRIGSLFVNPGGPGASAVSFVHDIRKVLPADILSRFDLVAFDPRGTGESDPISCETGPELDRYFAIDPSPDNTAEHDQLEAANKQFAQECAQRTGALLGHVDTRTAARDMEFIRTGLGEDKISYLGYSYGTFLGAMYADLFPNRVRAFVLDGAIDPSLPSDEVNRQQAAGFERELNAFLDDCAHDGSCLFNNNGNPRAAFDALAASIDRHPLPTGSGRTVGPGEFFLGVVQPLYSKTLWPTLARALAQAQQNGRGDGLLASADDYTERAKDGSYGSLLSTNTAVNCIDHSWSKDPAHYDQLATQFTKESPTFGAALALGGVVCAFWTVAPVDDARPLHAAGSAPIVVIGTTGDPATPYQWAQALASQLQAGVLLTNQSEGHTSFGTTSPCIIGAEVRYFVDLVPPPAGTTCKS